MQSELLESFQTFVPQTLQLIMIIGFMLVAHPVAAAYIMICSL